MFSGCMSFEYAEQLPNSMDTKVCVSVVDIFKWLKSCEKDQAKYWNNLVVIIWLWHEWAFRSIANNKLNRLELIVPSKSSHQRDPWQNEKGLGRGTAKNYQTRRATQTERRKVVFNLRFLRNAFFTITYRILGILMEHIKSICSLESWLF